MLNKENVLLEVRNTLNDFFVALCWGVGVIIFAAPSHIAPGGVNGISVLLNYLFNTPIGTVTLLINIPLLLIAYRVLGRRFVLYTLRTLILYSIVTDVIFSRVTFAYQGDPMMAAIFGGLFNGLGTALVFMHGSTGGGFDIINRLVHKKYPYFSTGQLALTMNAAVMIAAALVYKTINATLYGLIFSFTSSRVLDTILNGADMGKCALIVTHKPEEISKYIIGELHRSATKLEGKGAYLQDDVTVLMCVTRKQQIYRLKSFVSQCDPHAFIVITDATQIIGKGFQSIDG